MGQVKLPATFLQQTKYMQPSNQWPFANGMIDNSHNCADGESERAPGTLGLCRSASCVARQNMRPVDKVNQRRQPCDLPGGDREFRVRDKGAHS